MAARDRLQCADLAVWMTVGAVAIALAGLAIAGRFEVDLHSFLVPAVTTVLLSTGGWFYSSIRNEARLGAILSSTGHLVGFAAVAAPLSYVAATAGFPLQDARLEAWDRQLGIDWTQLMTFVSLHPGLQNVLLFAYSSFALQSLTTVLALGIAGRVVQLKTFVGAFIATTLVTIAVSTIYPAAGPWLFLDIQPASTNGFLPASASSWPVFIGLREGTLHTVYGLHSEGIITFPSLHGALGVLFATALWPVKRVRWIALGLNGLLLIATPAYGSHYIVDVIAGIVLAVGCWVAIARVLASHPSREFRILRGPPLTAPEALPASASEAFLGKTESL